MPDMKDPPFASGAEAEFYGWKEGQALKLRYERDPLARENEAAAGRIASAAGLPVPAVIDALVEVDDREGIVFERVNGPTMAQYVTDHPDSATECARLMASLHVEINQREVPESLELPYLLDHNLRLAVAIVQADGLSPDIRNAVLGVLDRLPRGTTLCHGDFHPENIIMVADGPVVIDWVNGARGNPLADFARTWLLFRLVTEIYPEAVTLINAFWQAYSSRYRELSSCPEDELANWRIVQTAASLLYDRRALDSMPALAEARIDFVHAMLSGGTHRWMT